MKNQLSKILPALVALGILSFAAFSLPSLMKLIVALMVKV